MVRWTEEQRRRVARMRLDLMFEKAKMSGKLWLYSIKSNERAIRVIAKPKGKPWIWETYNFTANTSGVGDEDYIETIKSKLLGY